MEQALGRPKREWKQSSKSTDASSPLNAQSHGHSFLLRLPTWGHLSHLPFGMRDLTWWWWKLRPSLQESLLILPWGLGDCCTGYHCSTGHWEQFEEHMRQRHSLGYCTWKSPAGHSAPVTLTALLSPGLLLWTHCVKWLIYSSQQP